MYHLTVDDITNFSKTIMMILLVQSSKTCQTHTRVRPHLILTCSFPQSTIATHQCQSHSYTSVSCQTHTCVVSNQILTNTIITATNIKAIINVDNTV